MGSIAQVGSTSKPASAFALRSAGLALLGSAWVSGVLFALYIVLFYLGALGDGTMSRWNRTLPRLYEAGHYGATAAIGAHFAAGALLLLLGPIQLVRPLRDRFRTAHRWIGRSYVVAAALAGLGGLGFIVSKGTIGGPVMSAGFGLYGMLMVLAAVQTWRFGAARLTAQHRAWGIRLVALVIGSWLYRIEYGFWMPLTHGLGTNPGFTGPFDRIMAFFFYVPNLLLAETFVRERRAGTSAGRWLSTGVLTVATAITLLATWYFAVDYWMPGIEGQLADR